MAVPSGVDRVIGQEHALGIDVGTDLPQPAERPLAEDRPGLDPALGEVQVRRAAVDDVEGLAGGRERGLQRRRHRRVHQHPDGERHVPAAERAQGAAPLTATPERPAEVAELEREQRRVG